jgi:hypothetical protein
VTGSLDSLEGELTRSSWCELYRERSERHNVGMCSGSSTIGILYFLVKTNNFIIVSSTTFTDPADLVVLIAPFLLLCCTCLYFWTYFGFYISTCTCTQTSDKDGDGKISYADFLESFREQTNYKAQQVSSAPMESITEV